MLHFSDAEFMRRRQATLAQMEARELDALLVFSPESQFWLTGFDTFGYCFFQCLVVTQAGNHLLVRSADFRQAQLTSNVSDIRIWKDGQSADPAGDLASLLSDLGLSQHRLGIETNTHGLTAMNGQRVHAAMEGFATLVEASDLISALRLTKSDEEIAYIRKAATLCDDAFDAALPLIGPGAEEARILAAMQGAVLEGGGDYPGNEFIIGSGEAALLCRYQSGRRKLDATDQITLEWAGAYRHYHVAAMRTVPVGEPHPTHLGMHDAAKEALLACEAALVPGRPMADVFDAHARTLDAHGLSGHRLNACGYALGARFSPSWMEDQMFYEGAATVMAPGQVYFLHMILMNSDAGTAMCLGRTSLVTKSGPECLSRLGLDLITG